MTTRETHPESRAQPEIGIPANKAPLRMSELMRRLKEEGLLIEGSSEKSGPLAIIGAPMPAPDRATRPPHERADNG